jgi:fermentation-respiration switch protein FrsA (DUF1100 family)
MALVLGLSAVLFLGARMRLTDRLIFLPARAGDWDAARRAPFPIEEVTFTTDDGVALVSWYLHAERPRATVLFFHGNAGNLTDRLPQIVSLGEIGADVLIVGYRGYGRSQGTPSEAGVYRDGEAAYRYLVEQRGVPATRLVIFGESLGSGPAIELASRHPCAGLVVQSGFTSIADMAARVLPLVPVRWLLATRFENLAKIPSVRAPKLFLATRDDEVVPFGQTRRLYEASSPPRSWVEFAGCGHNELYPLHTAECARAVGDFIATVCPAA